jgi:chemotaxis protein MotB
MGAAMSAEPGGGGPGGDSRRQGRYLSAAVIAGSLVFASLLAWWGEHRVGALERQIAETAHSLGVAEIGVVDAGSAIDAIAGLGPELERLRVLPARLQQASDSAGNLARELEGSRAAVGKAEARIAELEQTVAESHSMLASVEQQRDALQAARASLQQDLALLTQRETELRLTVSRLEEQAAERETAQAVPQPGGPAGGAIGDEGDRMAGELAEAKRRNDRLEGDLRMLRAEREEALAKLAAATEAGSAADAAGLRSRLDEIAARSSAREAELTSRVAMAEATAAKIADRLEAADAALVQARTVSAALEAKLDEAGEALTRLQADITVAATGRSQDASQAQGDVQTARPAAPSAAPGNAVAAALDSSADTGIEAFSSPEPVVSDSARGEDLVPLGARPLGVTPAAGEALVDRLRHGGVALGETALFAAGEAALTDAGRSTLAQLASELRAAVDSASDGWSLRIEGHSDGRTAAPDDAWASSRALSAARANAVADYLVGQGLPAERLIVAGLAETPPAVSGMDDAARHSDRRIELRLVEG